MKLLAKYELERILIEILSQFNFLDGVVVQSFSLNGNTVEGIFQEVLEREDYSFSLVFDEDKNLKELLWTII